ncbi:MAG: DUF1318 domain-containing protein [Opitutales bacterium]|nr:DUF1318 domain-containing protein [Opitutales bacterium]MDG1325508.1 DUF1318 domain-containing protein [Opitutales bacterium]
MKFQSFLSFFLFSVLLATFVSADSNLTTRMKARLPDVLSAKNSGVIGEGLNGLLSVRDKATDSDKKLVADENKDRQAIFQLLAKKTGGDPGDVAKKFAKGIAAKAKKGHWFKNSSGSWVSK